MRNRITAIVGAGAVLDFNYDGYIHPSTKRITKELLKINFIDNNGKKIELVNDVHSALEKDFVKMKELDEKTSSIGTSINDEINFEVLFYAIESLYSCCKAHTNEKYPFDRYPYSWLASLVDLPFEYDKEDYRRALVDCTRKIIKIVDSYDKRFVNDGTIGADWYSDFWKSFGNDLNVFNFNYDSTIENSIGVFEDGFVDLKQGVNHRLKRFEPEVLWYNKKGLSTICHLHGNIRYGLADIPELRTCYGYRDLYKYQEVDYKDLENRMFLQFPTNQAREEMVYAPIITGLRKMDKLCYMPSNFYHAYFAQRILENYSLLIVGCSFGDLYANQLIERHNLIHQEKQRIVLIDWWDLCERSDAHCLYNYVNNCTSSGFRGVLFHLLWDDSRICFVETRDKTVRELFFDKMEWRGHYWALKDGRLRIYIDGFKDAVENHKSEIIEYLNS